MDQYGKIVKIENGIATVSIHRSTACGNNCASCGAKCNLKEATVVADADASTKIGDLVRVSMPSSRVLLASFLVYIVPLILFVISYIIFSLLNFGEEKCVAFSIIVMLFFFLIMHFVDKMISSKYRHKIYPLK